MEGEKSGAEAGIVSKGIAQVIEDSGNPALVALLVVKVFRFSSLLFTSIRAVLFGTLTPI